MRILITTPLYPPDIAPSAPYVKELASRLSHYHDVTVLAYGHIPESVPNVCILTVSKRAPLIERMLRFTKEFFQNAHNADMLIIENGPSVEVPFILTAFFIRKKKIFSISDVVAEKHTHISFFHRISYLLAQRLAHVVTDTSALPPSRPEIHPFKPYPQQEFDTYEESWKKHIAVINSYCT